MQQPELCNPAEYVWDWKDFFFYIYSNTTIPQSQYSNHVLIIETSFQSRVQAAVEAQRD